MTLCIGISARLLNHAAVGGMPPKRLRILGSIMAQWIRGRGAVARVIPVADRDYAAAERAAQPAPVCVPA